MGSLNPPHHASRGGAGTLVGRVRSAAALWNVSSAGAGFRYDGPTAQPDTQSCEKRLTDARAARNALVTPALSEANLMWAPLLIRMKATTARRTDAEHPVLSASVVLRVTRRRSHETGPAKRAALPPASPDRQPDALAPGFWLSLRTPQSAWSSQRRRGSSPVTAA